MSGVTSKSHFNGTSWSLTQAPDLGPNYPINVFNTVLALSPSNVWAIGQSSPGNQTFATLVEHFDGTSWTVQPAPRLSGNSLLSFGGLVNTRIRNAVGRGQQESQRDKRLADRDRPVLLSRP